jgi:uncharacterized protein
MGARPSQRLAGPARSESRKPRGRVSRALILLPPSEGKAVGGRRTSARDGSLGELAPYRAEVRAAVRTALATNPECAEGLLGVRGLNLERALAGWVELESAPCLPALQRYSGVVWSALSPETLDPAGRRRLNRRVLIPSGLFGLVAANDPLPAYRLKMGARVPPIGSLAAFWRPHITPLIAARAGKGWVIDLLPNEHAAAIDFTQLRHLRVEILDGGGRAIGHMGKSLKGLLARAIIESDATNPNGVAALEVPGLQVDPRKTTDAAGAVTIRFTVTGQGGESIH